MKRSTSKTTKKNTNQKLHNLENLHIEVLKFEDFDGENAQNANDYLGGGKTETPDQTENIPANINGAAAP